MFRIDLDLGLDKYRFTDWTNILVYMFCFELGWPKWQFKYISRYISSECVWDTHSLEKKKMKAMKWNENVKLKAHHLNSTNECQKQVVSSFPMLVAQLSKAFNLSKIEL